MSWNSGKNLAFLYSRFYSVASSALGLPALESGAGGELMCWALWVAPLSAQQAQRRPGSACTPPQGLPAEPAAARRVPVCPTGWYSTEAGSRLQECLDVHRIWLCLRLEKQARRKSRPKRTHRKRTFLQDCQHNQVVLIGISSASTCLEQGAGAWRGPSGCHWLASW